MKEGKVVAYAEGTQTNAARDKVYKVEIELIERKAESIVYRIKASRLNGKFCGSSSLSIKHKAGNESYKNIIVHPNTTLIDYIEGGKASQDDRNKELIHWFFPAWKAISSDEKKDKNSIWKPDYKANHYGNVYYNSSIVKHTKTQINTADKTSGWVTASIVHSKDYEVSVPRGNNRKGTIKVWGKIESTGNGNYNSTTNFNNAEVSAELSTLEIADPTIIGLKMEVNLEDKKNPMLEITFLWTNPESYYTADVFLDNTNLRTDETITYIDFGSFFHDIPITKDMFGTTKVLSVSITGKDKTVYATKSVEVTIPEREIGVFTKQTTGIHAVDEVWYKDSEGNISKVEEVWVTRGNKGVKTIK